MPPRSLMPLAALTLLAVLPAPVLAQSTDGPGGRPPGPRLTPAQQQAVFPEQKALTLRSHRARLNALQEGLRCLENAGDWQALRGCMKQERRNNMEERRAYWSELRALYARNGITLPQPQEGWRRRQQGPGSGSGAGGGSGAPRSSQPAVIPYGGR
ncbi:MAG: hypothetical protein VKI83_09800 [Synechococcaceae cyanobacterium]|nr:hypothetical protein [Synechococcaceae cyanobacterium]